MFPHPSYRILIPWLRKFLLKKNAIINKQTNIILNHHVPDNFLFISVFAVLIYVRSHVNVPFHHLQIQILMFHQYLLEKFIRVHHRSNHHLIAIKKCEIVLDYVLSIEHLHRSLIESSSPRFQIHCSKFHFLLLIFSFLVPLTFASKLPSATNIDLFLFNDYTLGFSLNFTSQIPHWHVGCCIRSNQTMCDSLSISSHSIYVSNDSTSTGTFLFDGANRFVENRRVIYHNDYLNNHDFLNNQTQFCQRYDAFRYLSSTHLAIFTSCIVIIGIIFNAFVFLVLIAGSLRRSTSFTLFVALTCFDLLSLASSLFSILFRTVMPHLRGSPIFCKMFGIFFLYFRQCSSTTLLLIAIERCVVIKYPFCRYIFDKFRLLSLAFIMIIYVVPIPFDFVFYTSGKLHCEAFDTLHADRYQIFRGFLTVFSYAMIPFVGISISNLLIIIELKNSKKRFITKDDDGTTTHVSANSSDKRGTTVMLFVASFAFLLLLGPFYIHWCITYLFYNYRQCHFTRNLYENVQVCMGVFHPYLTVIEKGMRESNHAINFLLYMATSKRFRSDFKRIMRRYFYRLFGPLILFLHKYICFCCPQSTIFHRFERHISDVIETDLSVESKQNKRTAYKTAHYLSNFERRRQNQLLKATLLNNNNTTVTCGSSPSPSTSHKELAAITPKTVRTLTWNPYDPCTRQTENQRQAIRLSEYNSPTEST